MGAKIILDLLEKINNNKKYCVYIEGMIIDMSYITEAIRRDMDNIANKNALNFTLDNKKPLRAEIEKQLRAEGYTDPDIIEFEIEDRLGMLEYEPFETL